MWIYLQRKFLHFLNTYIDMAIFCATIVGNILGHLARQREKIGDNDLPITTNVMRNII